MRPKSWRVGAALLIVLAACSSGGDETTTSAGGSDTSTTAGSEATGGTVRIGWGGAPADLNPGVGVLVEDYILYNLVYDALLSIDLEGNFQPKVATDWSVSDDGMTWTLTIRDDITFHDGTPLTAEDLLYSLTLYRDTLDFPYLPSYLTPFTTIEAPWRTG